MFLEDPKMKIQVNLTLEYYSAIARFCVEGLPEVLDFDYFVLNWWQTVKKKKLCSRVARTCLVRQNCPLFD